MVNITGILVTPFTVESVICCVVSSENFKSTVPMILPVLKLQLGFHPHQN